MFRIFYVFREQIPLHMLTNLCKSKRRLYVLRPTNFIHIYSFICLWFINFFLSYQEITTCCTRMSIDETFLLWPWTEYTTRNPFAIAPILSSVNASSTPAIKFSDRKFRIVIEDSYVPFSRSWNTVLLVKASRIASTRLLSSCVHFENATLSKEHSFCNVSLFTPLKRPRERFFPLRFEIVNVDIVTLELEFSWFLTDCSQIW